jgi:beta-lactam-binding protein with PASTA domain
VQLSSTKQTSTAALLVAAVLVCVLGLQVSTAIGGESVERPLIRVPKVIGLKPHKANRRLHKRRLKVHYTALTNACAGVPPGGHIIAQSPVASSIVPVHSTVQLQTSCH